MVLLKLTVVVVRASSSVGGDGDGDGGGRLPILNTLQEDARRPHPGHIQTTKVPTGLNALTEVPGADVRRMQIPSSLPRSSAV